MAIIITRLKRDYAQITQIANTFSKAVMLDHCLIQTSFMLVSSQSQQASFVRTHLVGSAAICLRTGGCVSHKSCERLLALRQCCQLVTNIVTWPPHPLKYVPESRSTHINRYEFRSCRLCIVPV